MPGRVICVLVCVIAGMCMLEHVWESQRTASGIAYAFRLVWARVSLLTFANDSSKLTDPWAHGDSYLAMEVLKWHICATKVLFGF